MDRGKYILCYVFFPWIGGVIGIATWGIYHLEEWLASYGIDYGSLFFTILMVVAPIIITGGIHMDGFLDTQDASVLTSRGSAGWRF